MKDKVRVKHPLEVLKNEDSKILILGSFPSVKSREMNFFYMNKTNRFYLVLSSLLNEDIYNCNIELKKEILLKRHIALYDVVEECEIVNSSDSSIKIINYCDLDSILKNTKIECIFLNGNTAYTLFIKKYPQYSNKCFKLPSTSSANAKMRLDDLINEWKILLNYLD